MTFQDFIFLLHTRLEAAEAPTDKILKDTVREVHESFMHEAIHQGDPETVFNEQRRKIRDDEIPF